MKKAPRFLLPVVLLLISACSNPPTTTPKDINLSGRWVDPIVSFEACNQTTSLWIMDMTFIQTGQTVAGISKGVDQWTFGNNHNYIGDFSGKLTAGVVKGILTLINAESAVAFDANLHVKNDHLVGALTSKDIYTCPDKSKVKPVAKVSFITDINDKVMPDSSEPNDTRSKAATLANDQKLKLSLNSKDVDWFTFEIKEISTVTLTFEALTIFEGHLELRDANNVEKGSLSYDPSNLSTQANILPLNRQLGPGIYYVVLSGVADETFKGTHSEKGNYSLGLEIETVPDIASEPNDTPEQATKITNGFSQELFGGVGDVDYFTFTLSKPQSVKIDILTPRNYFAYTDLLDKDLNRLFIDDGGSKYDVALKAGTYFLQTRGGFKTYTLNFNTFPLIDDAYEPNDSASQAQTITSLDTTLHTFEGDEDWFKIILNQAQLLVMKWEEYSATDYPKIYNDELQAISYYPLPSSNYVYGSLSLGKGTYYIQLKNDYVFDSKGESYYLMISLQALSDAAYEPNNSAEQATPIPLEFNNDNLFLTSEDEDWYTFNLPQGGFIDIQTNNNNAGITLYDSTLKVRAQSDFGNYVRVLVSEGTYYLRMTNMLGGSFAYSLNINIVPDDTYAPNQTYATAAPISLNFSENQLLIAEYVGDFFSFTLTQQSNVQFHFADNDPNYTLDLYGTLYKTKGNRLGLNPNETQTITLEPGTYVFGIENNTDYGQYRLSVSATPF
jgi:hypothetical protein